MARIHELTAARNGKGLWLLALLSGVLAAVFTIVAIKSAGGGGGDGASAPATASEVVVAGQDIPAGTEITAAHLQAIDVPTNLVVLGAFTEIDLLIGETSRVPIAKGEQITRSKVGVQSVEADGLEFVVPKGMRAISVDVNEVRGVGGLLLAGNRVDVIAVAEAKDLLTEETPGIKQEFDIAFTVLQNVEVLSVAQKAQTAVPPLEEDAASEGAAEATTAADTANSGQRPDDAKPQPDARTVTLAVTSEQAQLLALIDKEGDIWLSLRRFGEDAPSDLPPVVSIVSLAELLNGSRMLDLDPNR